MRKWLALGAMIVVVVVWYSYLASSRADQVEREEASEPEASSAPPTPPLTAAAAAQPVVAPEPVAPKVADGPTHSTPESGDAMPDRNVLFAKQFDTEPRDALWANEEEPAMKKQLSEVELSDEKVSAVECRRSVCRVTFKAARLNEGEAINLYSRMLTTFGDVQLANHDKDSAEVARFYTLRKGYKLDGP